MSSPAPTHSFDLASLDPHHTYTSTSLSGGLVNFTSRITVSPSSEEHECLFEETGPTVVAKYAPPYIAALGESAPFDQFRQVIEARALALLNHRSAYAYTHSQGHNISTPSLIHHDPTNHILLMSDLGPDSITLDLWLLLPTTKVEDAKTASTRFGSFFAKLARVDPTSLGLDFSNPGARNMLLDAAVRGVRGNLIKCGIETDEADELTRLTLASFETQNEYEQENVFTLGDCWPRSLLVLDERGEGLAVIDWEFAGMNFPLQDVAQLAAHLYLLHETSPPSHRAPIQAFALSLFRTHYAETFWRHYSLMHRMNAWRLFGREIVNNVVEGDWFGADEEKRQMELKRLGKVGAGFIKDAMELIRDAYVSSAPPFEAFFSGL